MLTAWRPTARARSRSSPRSTGGSRALAPPYTSLSPCPHHGVGSRSLRICTLSRRRSSKPDRLAHSSRVPHSPLGTMSTSSRDFAARRSDCRDRAHPPRAVNGERDVGGRVFADGWKNGNRDVAQTRVLVRSNALVDVYVLVWREDLSRVRDEARCRDGWYELRERRGDGRE